MAIDLYTLLHTDTLQVRKEILECYALVQKLGKGVVYFGSSRTKADHPHYLQAMELGQEVSPLSYYLALWQVGLHGCPVIPLCVFELFLELLCCES